MLKLAAVSILLVGCLDPEPQPAPIAEPLVAHVALHEECMTNDDCEAPALCLSYHGVSGPTGPVIMTCEIKCDAQTACPDGTTCGPIADGPGDVCR